MNFVLYSVIILASIACILLIVKIYVWGVGKGPSEFIHGTEHSSRPRTSQEGLFRAGDIVKHKQTKEELLITSINANGTFWCSSTQDSKRKAVYSNDELTYK